MLKKPLIITWLSSLAGGIGSISLSNYLALNLLGAAILAIVIIIAIIFILKLFGAWNTWDELLP